MQQQAIPKPTKKAAPTASPQAPVQKPPARNETGIPDKVKAKLEKQSGLSLDAIRIHYNSSAPAALGALAYTRGNEIYLGPGQERHLMHELTHAAQQRYGAVRPNLLVKGIPVRFDPQMEANADAARWPAGLPVLRNPSTREAAQMQFPERDRRALERLFNTLRSKGVARVSEQEVYTEMTMLPSDAAPYPAGKVSYTSIQKVDPLIATPQNAGVFSMGLSGADIHSYVHYDPSKGHKNCDSRIVLNLPDQETTRELCNALGKLYKRLVQASSQENRHQWETGLKFKAYFELTSPPLPPLRMVPGDSGKKRNIPKQTIAEPTLQPPKSRKFDKVVIYYNSGLSGMRENLYDCLYSCLRAKPIPQGMSPFYEQVPYVDILDARQAVKQAENKSGQESQASTVGTSLPLLNMAGSQVPTSKRRPTWMSPTPLRRLIARTNQPSVKSPVQRAEYPPADQFAVFQGAEEGGESFSTRRMEMVAKAYNATAPDADIGAFLQAVEREFNQNGYSPAAPWEEAAGPTWIKEKKAKLQVPMDHLLASVQEHEQVARYEIKFPFKWGDEGLDLSYGRYIHSLRDDEERGAMPSWEEVSGDVFRAWKDALDYQLQIQEKLCTLRNHLKLADHKFNCCCELLDNNTAEIVKNRRNSDLRLTKIQEIINCVSKFEKQLETFMPEEPHPKPRFIELLCELDEKKRELNEKVELYTKKKNETS